MKKLLLLCLIFVFSNSFFAQEAPSKKKTKAKTEKVIKEKKETKSKKEKEEPKKKKETKSKKEKEEPKSKAEKEVKKSASDKGIEKSTAGKTKASINKADAKVKDESKKTTKKAVRVKESNEKAPKVADKITGEYNGKKVYTGPRGGRYYINSNGNKTYIQED